MKKLLIIDDEIDLLSSFKEYFQMEGYLVYTAKCANEGLSKLQAVPDLIVLDVSMPEIDGFELCQRIRNEVSCPILFLSAREEEENRIRGLQVGGDDYLIKPVSLKELSYRIAAHLRREERRRETVNPSIRFFGDISIDEEQKQVFVKGDSLQLTKVEFEIVSYLTEHVPRVCSKEMIYTHLWQYEKEGNEDIIMEHIRRIRNKFLLYTKKEVVHTVWGQGYQWIG
ncbi:DNA-binding response regulator [Enterococcus sp. JM4C]|uniref:response regulator transcription factor n=1 Tax=Candidatus Enterococcus huntleyi TaxID=1857217 RepID=UPI00137AEA88|nr:response regulator transcription factor [Enterococcus sp. JM4C]KAF1299521.1 DNA-binding response regulator [Enterococcus sp. JM4C]